MKIFTIYLFLSISTNILAQPLIDQAAEFYSLEKWEEARQTYQEIVNDNPYHNEYWNRYGIACLKTKQLEEAIQANKKALELGTTPYRAMYHIAASYALMGKSGEALIWLGKSLQNGYPDAANMINDPDLQSLIEIPKFKQLTNPTQPKLEDRIEGWRSDLDYLTQLITQEHINPFHTINVEEWEVTRQELRANIPKLSDLQIVGELMSLMAKIGDGHTVLYPPFEGKYTFSALPLEFYLFKDELLIRAADPKYKELVGTKVLQVGDLPIEQVLERIDRFISRDNAFQVKWISPIALSFAEVYQLIGANGNGGAVSFTLESPDGKRFTQNVVSGPLTRDPMSRFAPKHWLDMRGNNESMWTSDPENYYWFEYLNERQVVYAQFNQVRNKPDQSIVDFSKSLSEFIHENPVKALIIDIRLNNGGNNFLNRAFVHEIIRNEKINVRGKLFVIIGRRTFSAAMNLASDLENNTAALFVGEPTGSRPNFYGEDNLFVLPYSGLTGSISSRYWQGGTTSDDSRPWIAPHIIAEPTANSYRNGVDPAVQAIFNYLDELE